MTKTNKIILGLVITAVIILILWPLIRATGGPVIETIINGGKGLKVERPQKTYVVTPSNNPVDRVHSRATTGVFEIIGKGEHKKWSVLASADFTYLLTVSTESRILSKEALESGRIEIKEKRKFNLVRDDIIANNADVRLDLDENAINMLGTAFKTIGTVLTTQYPSAGLPVIVFGEMLTEKLKDINGTSLKEFFETKKLPEDLLNSILDGVAAMGAKQIMGLSGIRTISGQEFDITWNQAKTGAPLHSIITKSDGSPLTEEERFLLSRLNILLDYDMVPQKEFKIGDKWSINATDFEQVFDPFIDGHFTGVVDITVKDKNENDVWSLEMAPCSLRTVSSNGKTIGNVSVTKGEALISPKDVTVDKVIAEGVADINHVSRHHFLFQTTIEGSCTFRGVLTTEPLSEESASVPQPESGADTTEN